MALSPETQARIRDLATAGTSAEHAMVGYTELYFANLMVEGQEAEAEKMRLLAASAFERKLDAKAAAIELVRRAVKKGEV